MIEKAIEEIKEFIKDKRLVATSMKNTKETEDLLVLKGFNIMVMWDYSFRAHDKTTNTSIPCVCLNDGQVSYYNRTHLIKGKIRCEGCRVDLYKEMCKKNSREYLGHEAGENVCYVITKCIYDGEVSKVTSSELLANNIRCKSCTTNKYKTHCKNIGYEYLGEVRDSTNKTRIVARCPNDGYIRAFSTGTLISEKIMCRFCQVKRYSDLLSTKNCTYKKHYPKGNHTFVVYTNNNGDEFEISSGNLKRLKFPISKDTHWLQEHSVYAIEAKDEKGTYIKIGTANFPEQRYLELKILCESNIKTLATYENRFMANSLETYLHRLFKENSLTASDVNNIIGKSMNARRVDGEGVRIKDGATEWFSGSIAETLYSLDFAKIKV